MGEFYFLDSFPECYSTWPLEEATSQQCESLSHVGKVPSPLRSWLYILKYRVRRDAEFPPKVLRNKPVNKLPELQLL